MNPSRMYTFFLAYPHGRERLLMSMGVHNLFLDSFFFYPQSIIFHLSSALPPASHYTNVGGPHKSTSSFALRKFRVWTTYSGRSPLHK